MLLKDELLLELIEQLPIGVFAKDPNDNYNFVIWNKRMETLIGLTQKEAIGANDFDFFEDKLEASYFRKTDEKVIADGHVVDIAEEVVSAKMGEIVCHTLKVPLRLADGRQLLVGIMDDITEESANKKQLDAYRNDLETLVTKRTHQLQDLANRDSLTGLANRNFLLTELKTYIGDRTLAQPLAVLFVDLNGFKLLNDSYGHRLGDELLYQVGQRLEKFRKQAPIVARLGGDEFVLVVESADREVLAAVAKSIYAAISIPFHLRNRSYQITCAIGISLWPNNGDEATLLLQTADMAMYNVKQSKSGSKHFAFYNAQMLAASQRKSELEQALRYALEKDELYLVLQPQFALNSRGKLIGAEVLLRWQSAKFGLVSPAEFIPIAERSDLMLSIGSWVLQQSCVLIKLLQTQFTEMPRLSVNLSGAEITRGLAERINKQLAIAELPSNALTLEITEAQLVNFNEDMVSELELLRQQGLRISIDDFGTGYSSMSYLSQLEFDELKIDRSFVAKMSRDKKALLLVRAIVSMAHALESEVVAEGVETTEQLEYLKDMGIEAVQGFLLGKPMPYEEFSTKLSSGHFLL